MKTGDRLVRPLGGAPGALLLFFLVALTVSLTAASTPVAKPAIYEFERKFCPVCREMEEVLKEVEARYAGQITLRFLDITKDEPLFRQYKVTFVPTQIFLDAAGREVYRHEGVISRERLVEKLKALNFVRD